MGIVAKINNSKNIGRVEVNTGTKASLISPNFSPKPNVALTELRDTLIVAPENGHVIYYNASTNKFENKFIDATSLAINKITGGTF